MSRLRAMRGEDVPQAGLIAAEALGPRWDSASIEEELARDVVRAFVLEVDNTVCALLVGTVVAGEHETLAIATHVDARRQGYARQLLRHALDAATHEGATAAFLEVRVGNDAARALYRSLGFELASTRRGYYADGEDACVMAARLESVTPVQR